MRQFETVFKYVQSSQAKNSPRETASFDQALDYLLIGTFNEHIAQPQANPFAGNEAAMSMGLEGDAFAESLWVDMYGPCQSECLPRQSAELCLRRQVVLNI